MRLEILFIESSTGSPGPLVPTTGTGCGLVDHYRKPRGLRGFRTLFARGGDQEAQETATIDRAGQLLSGRPPHVFLLCAMKVCIRRVREDTTGRVGFLTTERG